MSKEMKTPLSPEDIEVLIWCYCRNARHEPLNASVRKSIEMFRDCDMITVVTEDIFRTTSKGTAMIKELCNTSEPELLWGYQMKEYNEEDEENED